MLKSHAVYAKQYYVFQRKRRFNFPIGENEGSDPRRAGRPVPVPAYY
jgi:hypothetical protein